MNEINIELSTVYFYKGDAPKVIALRDCSLPMKNPIPGAFSALYGYQSKQDGFMAARAYAEKHHLEFTVIDLLMKLDVTQNRLTMKPGELSQYDFVSFQRLSRGMLDELGELIRDDLLKNGHHSSQISQMDFSKPQLLIMQNPKLLKSVMDHSDWKHLKVIVHPAMLESSDQPLSVGTIPHRYWGGIQEATCRLNPTIQITLDSPAKQTKSKKV